MYFIRETYSITPGRRPEFNHFFDKFLKANQLKNGANLLGCWNTEMENEILVIWQYPSYDDYLNIQKRVKMDELHQKTKEQLLKLGKLYLDFHQETLSSIGDHQSQKQTVTVSGYITNEKEETLLVRTYWRSDTWELPGGGVEDGETLDTALCREIFEETGITVKLLGVTGVYSNGSTVSIVFHGKSTGGVLRTSEETQDVRFVKLDSSNVNQYIKRGKFLPRVLDAMKGYSIPYEAFRVRPYKLLERLEGIAIQDET
ncbi:NUDIX domain-containing protein [Neobacillus drentensis]|jgi:8-oxo-dGTP diphosphatase|uniref:NUDIX domain-containing protein n=1 Tax=Neobacillus drentensis TaxID=220684 RepID=UPI003B58806A